MFFSQPPSFFNVLLLALSGGDFETLSSLGVALGALLMGIALLLDRRSPRLGNPYPFRLPSRRVPPPECRVRLYDPERDFESCAELYRLNAPGRFPEDVYEKYLEWLRSPDGRLTLVVESPEGELRATGGVHAQGDGAILCFGLVHPAHHRRGFGEVLLLARLAALPPPESPLWAVSLYSVSGSETYYARFGFRFTGCVPFEPGGTYERHTAFLSASDLRRCRKRLSAFGLNFSAGGFPAVPRAPLEERPGERELYVRRGGGEGPPFLALPAGDATTLRNVLEMLSLARWPTREDGEEAVWILRAGKKEGLPLALLAPRWPEPRFTVSPETPVLSLLPPGAAPLLYLHRHNPADLEEFHPSLLA